MSVSSAFPNHITLLERFWGYRTPPIPDQQKQARNISSPRCGLLSWPLDDMRHVENELQFCLVYFRNDATGSCNLVHWSVPSRCACERHTWKDPDRQFARVGCNEWIGGLTDSHHGRGRGPKPSQSHPKDELVTALRRVVRCRRTGVIMLGFFPRLTLRLHRQIVALALLPGTAFSMRLSVIYWVFLPALSLNLGWRLSEIWPSGRK
jgi:hypothetical protein